MGINDICDLLRQEFYHNYEYGFYLDGEKYKPNVKKGFDKEFLILLQTSYIVQNPTDTLREKIGTCIDVDVAMGELLKSIKISYKIWLLHDKNKSKKHTILTFEAEGKVVYLELTPQSSKPWYGKEIVYICEKALINDFQSKNYDITNVTEKIVIGAPPEFLF